MLERGIVNQIQKWLRANFPGCYLIKLESPSTAGILDLYFAYKGVSIWFECKAPANRGKNWKNKKIQEWHEKQLAQNGIRAYFVYSLDEVKDILQTIIDDKFFKNTKHN